MELVYYLASLHRGRADHAGQRQASGSGQATNSCGALNHHHQLFALAQEIAAPTRGVLLRHLDRHNLAVKLAGRLSK